MVADIDTFGMPQKDKEKFLETTLDRIIIDNQIVFEEDSKNVIFYHIFRNFLGFGRIDILMHDEGIEDISCDGPDTPIFIHHRIYEAIETNIFFDSAEELDSFLMRLCQVSGKQISIFSPIVDGKLPDGSRLQATLARTVTNGSTFTIRKFKETPLTPIDLIDSNSMSTEMAAYFWMAIEDGASILFCGGTASGKTTALNALMLFIPASHKIISIEDTREVSIPHRNWIAGTTRRGFAASDESKTGKDIDMFDLIRAALRQRPRVIIVGEVRGKEAYSLFQAMATGHTAYATVHASTIHTLIQRLENPPIELPRALLTSLDVIVFQNAIDIGGKMVRRMTSVSEIIKLDTDTNQLIFMAPYTWISKTDDRFESSGSSKILNRIKQQYDWSDEQLQQELHNKIMVLEWMRRKNVRGYTKFGRIIAEYKKFPEKILDLAKKDAEA
jgi:flagellar protein FlaI